MILNFCNSVAAAVSGRRIWLSSIEGCIVWQGRRIHPWTQVNQTCIRKRIIYAQNG